MAVNGILRNKKLLEAIGMLLVLGGWLLDWGSVQHWSSLESRYHESLASIQNGYALSHSEQVIRLEAAVTRAVIQNKIASTQQSNGNYAAAWASEEVRRAWHSRTETNTQMMRNIAYVVIDSRTRDLLGADDAIPKLNGMLEHIESKAKEAISSPSGREAGQVDTELSAASSVTVEIVNNLSSGIRDTREWTSRMYRLCFGIGSLLLLAGRCLDWWKEAH